ncbi:wax ester/triacylglycerol synthase family O-acyltransferase [uncultured Mycobacterium sp.]|uniref:WS/DGAT/MGAT family O-acyltransferase n=1 Tax=uncultured Mycobacterium sp. TaxID=171292 RepID=UPI0035C99AE6
MKRLSGWDATFVYGESPNVPVHTMKIAVVDTTAFDGEFTFDMFQRVVQRRLPALEPLRYQLINIPLKLHHPMWLDNCEVDLDYHVRRARLPSPGGRRQLDDLIAEIATTPLDLRRPPWEVYFVEGMPDRKFALVAKVHHSLADGGASANLLARAMDSNAPIRDDRESCTAPSSIELLRAAGRDHLQQVKGLPTLIADTTRGIARLRRRSRERGEHPELARPFSPPPTFMNHRVSAGRRFASATLPLADFKETSKHLEIKLNDLVLSVAAGAFRELLLRHDGTADQPIIASVPVNTDPSPDRISGNALGALIVSLPVQLDDPLERIRVTGVAVDIAKESNQLLGPELLGRWTTYLPPPVTPVMLRWLAGREARNALYNVSISNVPGPRERAHIAGAPMSEFYSVGPLTPGCGINITVWSYVDQLNISVLTDDRTLQDAHEVTDAMIHAFVETRHAAGLSGGISQLNSAMPQAKATLS